MKPSEFRSIGPLQARLIQAPGTKSYIWTTPGAPEGTVAHDAERSE